MYSETKRYLLNNNKEPKTLPLKQYTQTLMNIYANQMYSKGNLTLNLIYRLIDIHFLIAIKLKDTQKPKTSLISNQ